MIKKLLCVCLAILMSFSFFSNSFAADADVPMDEVNCITVVIKEEFSGALNNYDVGFFDMNEIDHIEKFIPRVNIPQWKNDEVYIYIKEPVNSNIMKAYNELSKDERIDYLEYGKPDVHLFMVKIGDIDGDDYITPDDARIIMRIAVGLDNYPDNFPIYYFDTDSDNSITVADARKALRIAVGIEKCNTAVLFL